MKSAKTKYVILGLLSESALSGYEIKRIIDIRFHFFWNESYGQIYPELKSLTKSGLIQSMPCEGAVQGKVKHALTESGRSVLMEWLAEPVEKESVRFELLLKMYFSKELEAGIMIRHLTDFSDSHRRQLDILEQFQRELAKIGDPAGNHKDILQVISFGEKVYRAYLDWSAEAVAYLRGREKT